MKIFYHRRDVFCQDNNCLIWKAPNFSFYMRKLQFGQRKTPVWTEENYSFSPVSSSICSMTSSIDFCPLR